MPRVKHHQPEEPFYLYRREGSKFFYAQLIDRDTGWLGTGKSTGKTTLREARETAWKWHFKGIPGKPKRASTKTLSPFETAQQLIAAMSLDQREKIANDIQQQRGDSASPNSIAANANRKVDEFLSAYWNFDTSPYVQDKLLRGEPIGRPYCKQNLRRIQNHWTAAFAKRTVGSLQRKDLKDFRLALSQKKQKNGELYARKTVNDIVRAGTQALQWAYFEELIPENIAGKLGGFVKTPKERGVLTIEEAEELFARHWDDRYAYVGNLLMSQSGVRTGEVLGIRRQDIGDEKIVTPNGDTIYIWYVRRAWEPKEGILKTPKNGKPRIVPLHPVIRDHLLRLFAENPHTDIPVGERFVFWSKISDRPRCHERFLRVGLQRKLAEMGIDWKARNIVCHSWRHFYASRLFDKIDGKKIQRVTGHISDKVFEYYASNINIKNVGEVGEMGNKIFANIITAAKKAGESPDFLPIT